jgi:hypothetical protein
LLKLSAYKKRGADLGRKRLARRLKRKLQNILGKENYQLYASITLAVILAITIGEIVLRLTSH